MDYLKVGEALFNFEAKRIDKYRNKKIGRWNSWPLLRRPLYYYIIVNKISVQTGGNADTKQEKASQYKFKSLVLGFIYFLVKSIALALFRVKAKLVMVFPFTIGKLFKNQDGKYVDVLIDPFIQTKAFDNYIYVEASNNGHFIRPAYIEPDLIADGILFPALIIKKILLYTNKFKELSAFYEQELNSFFASESLSIIISKEEIRNLFLTYWTEFIVYKGIFFLLKPKATIFNDELFSGKMTAALEANAQVIELQHGFIGNYKPDYFISGELKKIRNEVPLCHKLGVFGQFHRDNITYPGFWANDEIITLGNYKIELARAELKVKNPEEFIILFPTQWHVFEQSKALLQKLATYIQEYNLKLIIKAHPREPVAHLTWYRGFAEANLLLVTFHAAEADIYDLLQQCNLLIGYDSTVLLESIALGIPTITAATAMVPNGIHSYLWTDALQQAIKIGYSEEHIMELINAYRLDPASKQQWLAEVHKQGVYLYASSYQANIKKILADILA